MTALTIKLEPIINITPEQFYLICQKNPELKLELSAEGELMIMPPTGGETGKTNASITAQLWLWNEQKRLGEVFDSSCGFILPNRAQRSPDASWIEKKRWESLSATLREKFIPLCPDFVIELLSPTDSLKATQEKMQEYLDNGCTLGWLINRQKQEVEIYQPNKTVEVISRPTTLSGGDLLPDFVLNLAKIWI